MARGPEGKFKTKVDGLLPEDIFHQAMSLMFGSGTPDRYYEGPKSELWVEYKWVPKPKAVVPIDLCTPLQARWLRRAARNGRQCCVVVGSPVGAIMATPDQWDEVWHPENFTSNAAAIALMIEDVCRGRIELNN